jgi:hypothetical protein
MSNQNVVDMENKLKHMRKKVKKAEKEYSVVLKIQGKQEDALDFLDNRKVYDV